MLILRIFVSRSSDRFVAYLGERLVCRSRQPLLTAARVLLAEGVLPDERLGMCWGDDLVVALSGRLGVLARLTVVESEDEGPYLRKTDGRLYRHASDARALKSKSDPQLHPDPDKRTSDELVA